MDSIVSVPLGKGVEQRPADSVQIRPPELPTQITPQVETVVFDPANMTRDERKKHYIAQQFALGPLGDPTVTEPRFRYPSDIGDLYDNIPYNGSLSERTNPWDADVLDPTQLFSGPDEFSALVGYYRSQLTPEQKKEIATEEKAIESAKQAGPATISFEDFIKSNPRLYPSGQWANGVDPEPIDVKIERVRAELEEQKRLADERLSTEAIDEAA